MKHQNTIVIILVNILFCAILLWFFSYNTFFRPNLGSTAKEFLSGLLLLITLYANYFVLYPKLYRSHTFLYWLSVVMACLVTGGVELLIGYSYIVKCNTLIINECGFFGYFSKHLVFIFGRNLIFNFFPFMLREWKQLHQFLIKELQKVYQYARMIDVCDGDNNCKHISIDDIFYCKKYGNETEVYTVDGAKYTRYCTIKYLIQLFGNKEFVRISPSLIVPFCRIASCDGETVVMKPVPWTEMPLTFKLDTQRNPQIAAVIYKHLRADMEDTDSARPDNKEVWERRSPSVPPKEKLDAVLNYIKEHPGCRSTELMSHTSYSQTTIERCLSDLKKRGLVEYSGSKKKGGYHFCSHSHALDCPLL